MQRLSILYNTSNQKQKHVDLLLLMRENSTHFVLIKKLEYLLRSPDTHKSMHICRNCLQNNSTPALLERHKMYCVARGMQKTIYPTEAKSYLQFDQWQRTQKIPFKFYADFESIIKPCNEQEETNRLNALQRLYKKTTCKKNTKRERSVHVACGFSWICVDHKGLRVHSETYRASSVNEDVGEKFITSIIQYCKILSEKIQNYQYIAEHCLESVVSQERLNGEREKNSLDNP